MPARSLPKAAGIFRLRHPGEALVLVVVVLGQFLDRLRKEFAQRQGIGEEKGAEGVGLAHRRMFSINHQTIHIVTGIPTPIFSTDPELVAPHSR